MATKETSTQTLVESITHLNDAIKQLIALSETAKREQTEQMNIVIEQLKALATKPAAASRSSGSRAKASAAPKFPTNLKAWFAMKYEKEQSFRERYAVLRVELEKMTDFAKMTEAKRAAEIYAKISKGRSDFPRDVLEAEFQKEREASGISGPAATSAASTSTAATTAPAAAAAAEKKTPSEKKSGKKPAKRQQTVIGMEDDSAEEPESDKSSEEDDAPVKKPRKARS